MTWEILPTWFWIIYYGLLILTIVFAIYNFYKRRIIGLSLVAIILSIIIPIYHILYSLGREEGFNEFEHLFQGVVIGDIWALYLAALYLYLIVWWVISLFKIVKREVI